MAERPARRHRHVSDLEVLSRLQARSGGTLALGCRHRAVNRGATARMRLSRIVGRREAQAGRAIRTATKWRLRMSRAEPQSFGNPWFDYMRDAFERSVLFLDVLRERGNVYDEQTRRVAPNVLSFQPRSCGRAHAGAAGELRAGAHQAAGRRRHRPDQAALHRVRSARRTWPRHRRHEAGQRDRRGAEGRPSLLLRRLPAGADAGPDHRGRVRAEAPFIEKVDRSSSRRPRAGPA